MSTETRQTGRVKWFNPKTGFGFITDTTSSDDVFVHHSQITTTNSVYKTLTQGEYVSYSVTQDESGKSLASNVTGIGSGPLLCERPQTFRRGTGAPSRGGAGRGRGRGGNRGGRSSTRRTDSESAPGKSE